MPALTADSLLAELRRLKLLTDEAAGRVADAVLAHNLPPGLWARTLVEAGLTKFQARAVLAGHAAQLLLGPYVFLDRVGEGGMGVVYKARQTRLGRIDAVKVLRTEKVGSRTIIQRFRREIAVTSRLAHPHVVRAYDAGDVGGRIYLATEFVDGKNLAAVVEGRGPLTVADACLVVYQVALALRHVHEMGLVHRDIKPSNLIRDRATGTVKLLDLGLSGFTRSAWEDGGTTLTRDGVVLGTPDFMAPEQVQNPHRVDIRADLYGLGCTLYFLLTGRPPFDGSAVEKMYKHGFEPPPPLVLPSGLAPPAGLVEIIARLMAKKVEERFQTPQALIEALLAIRPGAAGTPEPATHTPTAATPAPGPFPSDQFDTLTGDGDSSPDTPVPAWLRAGRAGQVGVPRRWLIVAAGVLLFGLGFLAAAFYFSVRR